jgi:hypothetical protein
MSEATTVGYWYWDRLQEFTGDDCVPPSKNRRFQLCGVNTPSSLSVTVEYPIRRRGSDLDICLGNESVSEIARGKKTIIQGVERKNVAVRSRNAVRYVFGELVGQRK